MDDLNKNKAKKLVLSAKSGDPAAFSLIYDRFFTPIFRYLYYRLESKEEAEDLAQEVFFKAFNKIEKSEEGLSVNLSFFFVIARHGLIDYWRKKKPILVGDHNDLCLIYDKKDKSASENFADKELVHKAMAELTEEQKEVVVMKTMEGFSYAEMAAILGKGEAALRQIHCRAIKQMRDYFKKENLL